MNLLSKSNTATSKLGQNISRTIRAATNSTYPKGGVSCFADTFVVAESSVLRMKFCAKNPALRVAANRYVLFYDTAEQYLTDNV